FSGLTVVGRYFVSFISLRLRRRYFMYFSITLLISLPGGTSTRKSAICTQVPSSFLEGRGCVAPSLAASLSSISERQVIIFFLISRCYFFRCYRCPDDPGVT